MLCWWLPQSYHKVTIKFGKEQTMSKEEALKAFEQMLSEIDKDNWLFVGTINPQIVEWAIKALKGADDE